MHTLNQSIMNAHSKRGTALGVALVIVFVMSTVALSILGLAMQSHKLAMRNNLRAEARAVAEAELEAVYFKFNDECQKGTLPPNVPSKLSGFDIGPTPVTTNRDAFLKAHRDDGWEIGRSITVSPAFRGTMPGSTKIGDFHNVDARVIVRPSPTGPWANTGFEMRCGRLMQPSHATVFQVCVFYQGCDLEMAPSGDVTIDGEIICNGSVYLAANNNAASFLRLKKNVYFLQGGVFNKEAGLDGKLGTIDDVDTLRKPDTPVVNSNLKPPEWEGGGQAAQLKMLTSPENLLGGADAIAIQKADPELFPTVNDVYRSVLVPPPEAGNTNEYSAAALGHSDNPTIAAQRVYNKASLIITVDSAGNATIEKVVGGVKTSVTYSGVVVGTTTMYDDREKLNVSVTEIDIAKLKTFVGEGTAEFPDFKGLVYVNLKSGNSAAPSAVRLVNAKDLPVIKGRKGGLDGGFSLATNGGLYIKGSYNTKETTDENSAKVIAPSMLLGDAITVLSDEWKDAKSTLPVADRQGISDDVDTLGNKTNLTTVNAGLLTGSVPATDEYASGGVQNLIRYLEDWYTPNQKVRLFGSFGRLFNSKSFTRKWRDPTEAGAYYIQPRQRFFQFDYNMIENPPPASPEISAIQRGRFFYW